MNDIRPSKEGDDDFVHVYIPGTSKTTLLLLHGTGGDEGSLVPIANVVAFDASILAVRGKVLENGMPRFFRRFAEGVFDLKDLKFRANELADFLHHASAKYGFTASSLVAMGYSNGANIGAAVLLLRPEVFDNVMLFRPVLPFVPETTLSLTGKSVLISAARRDSLTPQTSTKELERLLSKSGAQVTVNWEEADHSLTQHDLESAKGWLARLEMTGRDVRS